MGSAAAAVDMADVTETFFRRDIQRYTGGVPMSAADFEQTVRRVAGWWFRCTPSEVQISSRGGDAFIAFPVRDARQVISTRVVFL